MAEGSSIKLSIAIPAYNESENIECTINEIRGALTAMPGVGENYEILVVDDCSDDGTFDVVAGFNSEKIRCLRLSRRSSSHIALRAALANARGELISCFSADGQEDPRALAQMLEKINQGYDLVWALRRNRADEPLSSRILALGFYKLLELVSHSEGKMVDFMRADYWMMTRRVALAVNACGERNTALFGLIHWLGFNQTTVEYDRRPRLHGISKWSLRSRLRVAMDWIIGFSGMPLKIVTLAGFVIAGLGLLYTLVVIFNYFFREPVLGWSSLMAIILVLGGAQMAVLGVMGEYLWRTIEETRRRPLFFIERDSQAERGRRA